jgi:glycosyltransferase involved in cell wall biosynthesis
MRRVLILCEYPTLLGGERSMLATVPAVRDAGFDVYVMAPAGGPLAVALHKANVSHIPWQVQGENGERLHLDRLRANVADIIREIQPQLLHANSLSVSRIAGPVAAACGVPSIGHIRDIITLSRQAIEDVNANRRLVAVSDATRQYHINQGIAAAKCIVSPNGVDVDELQPRPPNGYLHRELRLSDQAQLVTSVGQLGSRKGVDVVLRAASLIAEHMANTHWLIVGERTSNKPESRDFALKLEAAAHVPPVSGRVHFLGSRNDVPQLLNECALLVHGARQEPLGRVLLEAAASGVAVVATDVGGTREIFPAELDGAILVPPDDERALAEATLALLENEPRRQSLARAARRRAEVAFDIRAAAQRLIAQYEAVLNG